MPDMRIPGQAEPEERPPFVAANEKRALPKAPPLAPNKRVGFAVVGLGRLSLEEIIPAFGTCKLAKLTALMTGDLSKGRRVAEQYGIPSEAVFAYDDWKGLAARDDVQVVYVVTPNGLHVEQVKRAAAAGKQVLCEKPMAANSAEAQEMIDACKKAGVPLMIAYRCQYEPHNAEVTRMVCSGEFGALKLIEAHNGQVQDTAMQWRHNRTLAGGGALPDIGIYCLSFARFVTGEEPEDIFAWSWSTPGDARFKDVEENVAWQMRFPSDVVAYGLLLWCARSTPGEALLREGRRATGARIRLQGATSQGHPSVSGSRGCRAHRRASYGGDQPVCHRNRSHGRVLHHRPPPAHSRRGGVTGSQADGSDLHFGRRQSSRQTRTIRRS
ncbi:hypothetical protein BraRD5C2_38450 [Bradyrhizobium sp. RD5-C2]|nr:Gfo/Idh/MocA family oxidoreductase [Bradyrhizobium sp. RD5-C2]GIQ75404.1 hypothetical protein BraRD5C2_38450 [Bradyrhizobium sp. RD5-C2]